MLLQSDKIVQDGYLNDTPGTTPKLMLCFAHDNRSFLDKVPNATIKWDITHPETSNAILYVCAMPSGTEVTHYSWVTWRKSQLPSPELPTLSKN